MKVEYTRLLRFAQEDTPPERDYRLQHVIVYFIHNQAPKKILERTLLMQFADRNLGFDERYKLYEPSLYELQRISIKYKQMQNKITA